jgi:muramoyltetrapeptide carboxypeptidase
MNANRIHLISPANPLGPDAQRFGFDVNEFLAFAETHTPEGYRVTYTDKLMHIEEDSQGVGRSDDAARIRDLEGALKDERTLAIVATNGGAYLSRILSRIDYGPLTKRKSPVWLFGFSELSGLVNRVAAARAGRGVYWLCPTWLGWAIRPAEAARGALAEFWRTVPAVCHGERPDVHQHLDLGPITGDVARGPVKSGKIKVVGGCLAVLAASAGGALGKKIRPDGKWLVIEDIKEAPYRIDRHLAALTNAEWFEKVAGVLVGDFHLVNHDTQQAVVEQLKYHLPKGRKVPILTTRAVGHIWPMAPLVLNQSLELKVRGKRFELASGL